MSGRLFHAKLLFSGQFFQHSISKSSKSNCSSAAISNNGLGKNEYQPKRPWLEVQPEGSDMDGKIRPVLLQGIFGPCWLPDSPEVYNERIEQMLDPERFAQNEQGMLRIRSNFDKVIQNVSIRQLPQILRRGLLFEQKYSSSNVNYSSVEDVEEESAIRQEGFLRCLLQLELEPQNEEYKSQRMGILPRVDQLTDCQLDRCDQFYEKFRKDEVSMEGSSKDKAAKLKMDYLERLIFNTISMEGSPLSFRRMREILHASRSSRSTSNPTTICATSKWDLEVIGIQSALELAENSSERGFNLIEDLSLKSLAELHRQIVLDRPELAGKFRFELKENVYLGGLGVFKMPIEWQVVQEQMEMFFDFLRWGSEEVAAKRMHPIEFAALVHFVYVHIHPHVDGNGRLSRLLMNLALVQNGFPPIIIQTAHKAAYFHALQLAGLGNVRAFCTFIINRMESTLGGFAHFGPYARLPGDLPAD